MILASLVLTSFLFQRSDPVDADSKELVELVKADQADRQFFLSGRAPTKDQIAKMRSADGYRYDETKRILFRAPRLTAEGFDAAALLMQHGTTPGSYEMAHELSVCASFLGKLGSMPSTAEDRFLKTIKRPQRFGSQFSGIAEPFKLDPVDEAKPTAVTDYLRDLNLEPHLNEFRESGPLKAMGEAQTRLIETVTHRRDPLWIRQHAFPEVSKSLRRAQADDAGRALVVDLYNRDELVTDEDFWRAGMILESSSKPQELLLAHELVTVAFKEGDRQAARPFMDTWDKFLVSIGRKPRYSARQEPPSVRAILGG